MKKLLSLILKILFTVTASLSFAQPTALQPKIHMIYMGGNDCPSCVVWRGTELPKLQLTEQFNEIKFSFVTKSIRSTVPSTFFLPSEVKPYKDKLDFANASRAGSPQFIILVNDEVYDYYFGGRSAEDTLRMITAIRENKNYPFPRCIKLQSGGGCEIRG
jgi:hypothetical protein